MKYQESEYFNDRDVVESALTTIRVKGLIDVVDMNKFRGKMYGDEQVDHDLMYVAEREARFKETETFDTKEAKMLADVFEAVVHEQIELSDWFGPDASTRKASKYDDIKNGVDSIVEFNQELASSYLALAIDVTYGQGSVREKIDRIKREIRGGNLAELKYFESSDGSFRGRLFNVPRVVIGADRRHVVDLASLWVSKDKNRNKQLENHEIQFQILDEIHMQLVAYEKYSDSVGRPELVRIYKKQRKIIEKIILEKQSMRKKSELNYDEDDYVFAEIKSAIEKLNS